MQTPKQSLTTPQKQRKLSPWRVLLAIVIVTGVVTGIMAGMQRWQAYKVLTASQPWFAAYVDVTSTPTFAFDQMGATSSRDAVLSFIVSLPSKACTPSWGGAYTMSSASANLDLDRRIERLKQQGGSVAVSFGGLNNNELAVKCTDPTSLEAAYRSVVEHYNISTIDLDLEKTGLTDGAANSRRAIAIAKLQTQRRAAGKKLAVWVTLPVAPQGLSEDGTNAVGQLLSKGVDLAGVNVMTMDYGSSLTAGQTMQSASESALIQTARQLGILYQRAGMPISSAVIWSKIGLTPMIGQNDSSDEVFTLADAQAVNQFARSHHMGRSSMWSANRDLACGGNYVDVKVVSDSCSGVVQSKQAFATALGKGFNGSISRNAGLVTSKNQTDTATQAPDKPGTSPYQIWSETGAYLQGTKVVWHHNVYMAKWWTQNDVPDNPVLQTWQTPWELVGPVLPGEKPIPQAQLPAGTYPDWSGTDAYNTSQRVLFNGVPYQAKWWTQGNSPAAAASNADGSPWAPLTQSQINDLQAASDTTAS